MNPLGGGIIPQNPEVFRFIDKHNIGVARSAITFKSSHKEIKIVLTGMDLLEAVEENTNALNNVKYNNRKEIKEMADSLAVSLINYVQVAVIVKVVLKI